ncbi:uncharacterized protein LOC131853362 [Achroia grisella]|uniref:uncharacterized protein LOC131853362 n=1 Tax=Achroia grisella TaxID=688607 RepID=UPI0027D2C745|nr:uncharacterized protein LOC131853362 [Achroia grisella]
MAQAIQCQQNEHCEIGYCCSENYTCENCDSHSNQQMIPSSKPKLNINYEISDSYKHEIGSNGEDTEKTDNFSYYGVTIMVVFLAAIGCFLIYKIFVFYRRTDDITPIIKTASAPLAPPQPPPAYNFHYNRDIANVGYCSEKLPLVDFPHVAQERDGCQMASGYNPPNYVRIPR